MISSRALFALALLCLASAEACSSSPQPAQHGTTSASRLARARREMGLGEAALGEDDPVETPFELGPDHLPAMPEGIDPSARPFADALTAAREVLEHRAPAPEATLDQRGMQRWVDDVWSSWMREHGQKILDAHHAFETLESEAALQVRVVAAAIRGLLFARFAESISTVGLPFRIEAQEGDRLRFRQAFLRAAEPLWQRAIDQFGQCASATVDAGATRFGDWQRFCDRLAAVAEDAPRPIGSEQ